jgi:hypothetical protein
MKTDDLEGLVEEYGIQTFRGSKQFKGKTLVHFEEDQAADSERIVFKATLGDHRLDIPGGGAFNVELKVTYYSSTGDKLQNNLVRKAMLEAMWESTATRAPVRCAEQFQYLLLEDAVSGDRSQTDNARERSVTFNFIAQPKSTVIAQ